MVLGVLFWNAYGRLAASPPHRALALRRIHRPDDASLRTQSQARQLALEAAAISSIATASLATVVGSVTVRQWVTKPAAAVASGRQGAGHPPPPGLVRRAMPTGDRPPIEPTAEASWPGWLDWRLER